MRSLHILHPFSLQTSPALPSLPTLDIHLSTSPTYLRKKEKGKERKKKEKKEEEKEGEGAGVGEQEEEEEIEEK